MDAVIGHEAIRHELAALARNDPPAHALLLVGPDGSGRALLAREYALLLNCERLDGAPSLFEDGPPASGPCGVCRPCRLIAEGAHPDVVTVTPGDTLCRTRAGESSHPPHPGSRDIRLCQVRGMTDLAARFPFEARARVLIVDPAERLYRDAAHGLLKTLEEPPGHTVFVLLSGAPEALIETIRSRCHRIDLHPVPRATVEGGLLARGIDPAVAAAAASAARGRPGRAVAFAADPDLIQARTRLLDRCARIAAAGVAERLRYSEELRDRYSRDRSQAATELDVWEAYWEEQLRAFAADPDGPDRDAALEGANGALRAVARARDDLLANVQGRLAFDLMLLSFPRRTLAVQQGETATAHG